jgi:hypothetical protein
MGNIIYKIYQKILWLLGFPAGEYITFMLKRQELRLGIFWWLSIAATQGYLTVILHQFVSTAWFIVLVFPINEIALILVWHVVRTPEPETKKND